MPIPLVDLKAQYHHLSGELDAAIREVVEATAFVKGPAVARFEQAFAAYCEARHAVGVGNGTDALHLAFRAVGVPSGSEVVTTPTTFIATAEAVTHAGATVRFADVHPATWQVDPERLEEAITPDTAAVAVVHLYGHPADMDAVEKLAAPRGVQVVEDAAQAHGARHRGRRVGSIGQAAAFSFYPGKNLGGYGDGGAVVTQSDEVADRVRMLADHGRRDKYEHEAEGWNSRLDTIQAAVLAVKLAHLDAWNDRRRALAAAYRHGLERIEEVRFPEVAEGTELVHHLLVVHAQDRDALREHLAGEGVSTGVHYPVPLHLQPAYRHLGYAPGDFPVAEHLAGGIVSLPLYPELGEDDVERVCAAVAAFYGRR